MYEKYYDCKLMDDEYVIHLDGNEDNYEKENLFKFNRNDIGVVKKEWWKSKNPQFRKCMLVYANLKNKIKGEYENEC